MIVGMLVFGVLFWWLLLPLLLLVVDVIVVIALLAISIPARILFRRPWRVEAVATRRDGPRPDASRTDASPTDASRTDAPQPDGAVVEFATDVVGWRAALNTRDEIVEKLRLGYPAPIAVRSSTVDGVATG